MELERARCLLVGATSELGSRLARTLSDAGAKLALAGRNEEALGRLGDELGAPTARFDATDVAGCHDAVESLAGALGGLDAVIVLPGVAAFGPATELEPELVERLFEVNVLGPIALISAAVPHLGEDGVVVGFSAIVSEFPTASIAHYSAAKAALSAYLAALRHERRRKGINVIDVRPPHMATGFSDRPLAGSAPKLPDPMDPQELVDAVAEAMREDRREIAWDMSSRSLVAR